MNPQHQLAFNHVVLELSRRRAFGVLDNFVTVLRVNEIGNVGALTFDQLAFRVSLRRNEDEANLTLKVVNLPGSLKQAEIIKASCFLAAVKSFRPAIRVSICFLGVVLVRNGASPRIHPGAPSPSLGLMPVSLLCPRFCS